MDEKKITNLELDEFEMLIVKVALDESILEDMVRDELFVENREHIMTDEVIVRKIDMLQRKLAYLIDGQPIDQRYPWCVGCEHSSDNYHCPLGANGKCVEGDKYELAERLRLKKK